MVGRGHGIGLHRFDPGSFEAAVFLDVGEVQYNPLDPDELIAGVHPAARPGTYGLMKLRGGAVTARAFTDYPWAGLELYIDPAERAVYAATGTDTVEIRDLEDLHLREAVRTGVPGVTSAALDSRGRLWFISNPLNGGTGGLYRWEGSGRAELVRQFRIPVSLDSMRIRPWGRRLLVADHGTHTVECLTDDGEQAGTFLAPYVGGVKWSLDERVLVSSGRYDRHVFLLLILGAVHTGPGSGWFAFLSDYATQSSNRADAIYPDRVLIQWYLGFRELESPLPKRVPYVIRMGRGRFASGEAVRAEGFEAPTPVVVVSEAEVFAGSAGVEAALEMLVPAYSLMSPGVEPRWNEVERFRGRCRIGTPGVYRVRALNEATLDAYAVCRP